MVHEVSVIWQKTYNKRANSVNRAISPHVIGP